jgi:putative acetyltransferase
MVGPANLTIRFERDGDLRAIHEVNRSAFETQAEADLVDSLRRQGASVVSLVADDGGAIVGHILFYPVTVSADCGSPVL